MAGEVVEVGPQVKNFKSGDKVVSYLTLLVSFKNLKIRLFIYIFRH